MRARAVLVDGNNGSLCALDFCICSSCSLFLPSYQLAAQSPVFLLNAPLYGDTEQRLCCSPFLPLAFFFSLLYDNVP